MSSERFSAHFKIPKKEQNRIRKEYQDGKIASEALATLSAESLKNYTEMSDRVFEFFENLTGKQVNREVMRAYLFHWFEEGYEPADMAPYIVKQLSSEYYRENPEMLTIARLFPIKDQDRMNIVWDFLSHYQSLRTKKSKIVGGTLFKDHCGHSRPVEEYAKACGQCLEMGDLNEVSRFPYDERVPEELREFASQFRRQGEESLLEYQARTTPLFKEVIRNKILKDVGSKDVE